MAYVYQHIRNDTNEIFYIGIGSDTEGKYKRAYTKDSRNNPHWNRIVNKVGYRVEILIDGISWEEACKEEIRLIKHYGRRDLNEGTLVNMTDGGEGNLNPSIETRLKISKAHIGMKASEETRLKLRNRLVSEETKLKLKKASTGRKVSEETRLKLSKIHKGKLVSEETRLKISKTHMGMAVSEETKLKLKKAAMGRKFSEETRKKIGDGHRGKIVSEETKRNMSEAQILYYKTKRLNKNPPKPHQFF